MMSDIKLNHLKTDLFTFVIAPDNELNIYQNSDELSVKIGCTSKGKELIRNKIGAIQFDMLFTVRINPKKVSDYGTLENTMLACVHEVEDVVDAMERVCSEKKEREQKAERLKQFKKAGMLL